MKKKLSKRKIFVIVSIIVFFVIVALTVSLAWFTKQEIEEDLSLNFGDVNISVDDENGVSTFNLDIFNILGEKSQKLMPGSTIKGSVKINNIGTVACYYIVSFKSNVLDFEDLFFENQTLVSNEDNKNVGALNIGETHNIEIESKVDTNLSIQGQKENIECIVYAIQQRNLTKENAYEELNKLK